jgi:hypothetical protein
LLKGCNNDYHTRKMYHSRSYIPNTSLNVLRPCATILSVDISRALSLLRELPKIPHHDKNSFLPLTRNSP